MVAIRPLMRVISHDDVGAALDRLVPVALSDTGQSAKVADFLLAWWNGTENGTFEILHLSNVDAGIAEDMLLIMGYLAQNGVTYADAWGHRNSMVELWRLWREPSSRAAAKK